MTACRTVLRTVPDEDWDKAENAGEVGAKKVYGGFESFRPFYEWELIRRHSSSASLKELARILQDVRARDIHNGNVMLRGSQLVFTDPVAS
jgi:hypothetical protein